MRKYHYQMILLFIVVVVSLVSKFLNAISYETAWSRDVG